MIFFFKRFLFLSHSVTKVSKTADALAEFHSCSTPISAVGEFTSRLSKGT